MKLVNLTPHTFNLYKDDQVVLSVEPSGLARVSSKTEAQEPIDLDGVTLPVVSSSFGEVEGLPPETFNTIYFVSAMVRAACPERKDLCSPMDLVRNDKGHVLGCRSVEFNR